MEFVVVLLKREMIASARVPTMSVVYVTGTECPVAIVREKSTEGRKKICAVFVEETAQLALIVQEFHKETSA